ncbi:MAG: peptidoglycan-binding protein LysM [Gemmatimonadota bacterium]|nr:peptidoglycan-binding protein LysM [Gemmatimonadota bacterium]
MGLIDFVKDAGAKVFGGGDKAAASEAAKDEQLEELRKGNELLRYVKGMGLPVDDLKITFDDGTATITGTVQSTAVRENIVIGVGNVHGVARVDDRLTVDNPTPPARMYTVKSGDTLSKIAKEHYGDAMKYPTIFEANRPMLSDPDKIYPGQVLRIPAVDA